MSDLIQCLRAAYSENPAAALDMLPELFRAADEGKIVELPYPALTKEQLDSAPRLDREALRQRLRRAEEREHEAAEKALKKENEHGN